MANLTGNGADGISLIFSDATVTPRTGGLAVHLVMRLGILRLRLQLYLGLPVAGLVLA